MIRHFKTSQRSIMRGTFKDEGAVTSASSQIDVEDFNLTKDYGSTQSPSDFTPFVSTTTAMSARGQTLEEDSSQPETNTIMHENVISMYQCESPSSLTLSLQHTIIFPHDYNCKSVLSLPVEQSMLKVAQHLKNRSPAEISYRAYGKKPFHNSEEGNSGSDKTRRIPSPCYSTSNYDIIGDNNIPVPPTSCMSGTYLTPYNEVLPVLHLHNNQVEIAFPDRMSCVISGRPDRRQIREATEPLLSAPYSPNNLPLNVQRTVPFTATEVPENAAQKIEAPGCNSIGDGKRDPLIDAEKTTVRLI